MSSPEVRDQDGDQDIGSWARTSTTEAINQRTVDIDLLEPRGIVELILSEDLAVVPAVRRVAPTIARLAEETEQRMRRGGRLIYVGSGSSGRLGVLDAAECPPTYGSDPEQVLALIAGGPAAITHSSEASEDDTEQGRRDIAGAGVGMDDVVLGIAASGRTPYVLGAVAEARERAAFVAGLVCTLPAPLADVVDLLIAPIVGPEVISGSTRMKAGTAQKLVLNTLSTTVMIRLGKTYRNLMVDLRPSNEKLRYRASAIVAEATGAPHDEAVRALGRSGGDTKLAITMLLTGIEVEAAKRLLAAADGRVRGALAAAGRLNRG